MCPAPQASPARPQALPGLAILIADDHPTNRLLLKRQLSTIGYSVDGGITWNAAREGVRIAYSNVIVDGEDRRGELLINATHEGLISDIWVRRGDPQVESDGYDHNIGSGSESIDDIVTRLIAEND